MYYIFEANIANIKAIIIRNSNPKVGDDGVVELARILKKHPEVTWVGLFDQEITASGLHELLRGFSGNKSIFHLDLGRNPIGDEGIKELCSFLATNRSVTEIYLWETGITDEGGKYLEEMLLKNRVVSNLDVNDNPALSQAMKSTLAGLVKQGPSRVPASPRAGSAKLASSPN